MSDPKPRWLSILDMVTIIILTAATLLVFLYAPTEQTMGDVQRVFYFHVAASWTGMLGFIVAMAAGIFYLAKKDLFWDVVGLAGVEIGMVFMLIGIVTGSIWAYPAWNTWWTWDPRLTTVTIMELAYAAYLMLRAGIDEPERRARFGAVYAIIASLSVPLTFFSIRIWRTIHPVVVAGDTSGTFALSPKMTTVFVFALVTFSLIFVDLLWHRVRLGLLARRVEEKKLRLLD